jgi:hypothetical protein
LEQEMEAIRIRLRALNDQLIAARERLAPDVKAKGQAPEPSARREDAPKQR